MIRVREKQLAEIGRALALEQLEDEMVVQLRTFSPRHMDVIGDAWVRRAVRLGIERAGAYGVTNAVLLRFYVQLMAMFGSYFDVDPLHPWANRVFGDASISNEWSLIERMDAAMREYLTRVRDPKRWSPANTLRNLAQLLDGGRDLAGLRDERTALDTLARIYPERCAYVGEARLLDLVRRAPDEAARNDVGTDRGVVMVMGWMFGIGPGFADDPFYPWVRATLRDPAIKTPERRAERLQKRTQIYLDRALEHLEGRLTDGVQ